MKTKILAVGLLGTIIATSAFAVDATDTTNPSASAPSMQMAPGTTDQGAPLPPTVTDNGTTPPSATAPATAPGQAPMSGNGQMSQ
jgi:hypothetical protein